MKRNLKTAIIGTGIGGLTASIRLAHNGFDVSVFEKNSYIGGKAGIVKNKGFRFDSGPSLLTMPFVLEKIFNDFNDDIKNYLTIKPLSILSKYFYQDGTEIIAYNDIDKFADEIERKTLDNQNDIKKYFNYSKNIYDLTADLFIFNNIHDPSSFLNSLALKTLFNIRKIDSFRVMHEVNAKYFKDDKTVQLFDRYATYNGSNPYKAPATLNLIPYVEYNLGGFIVCEGISEIPAALHRLAVKNGVRFFLEHSVENILFDKNKKVNGLQIAKINSGKVEENFDIVISNADANYTYKNLINKNLFMESKRSVTEPSSSALVFYWGIKGIHENLEIHNILFSKDYKNEFDEIFNKKVCPRDPTIYIYISSKFKKDDAPAGHENWFVMINAPSIKNQDWNNEIQKSKENIIKKIQEVLKINLSEKIISEKIMSPVDIEMNTNSYQGSIYGISSNNRQAAFLRQRNRSKKYNGLYFCGGSTHPGGGIPLVVSSGVITANLIMKKYKNKND
ncbi:MAG: phytoene desaturase family protein [Ignavibacteriaceae bacterium]